MKSQCSYLSAARMAQAAAVRWTGTILGGLLTAFFGIGLCALVTDVSLRENWVAVLVMFLLSAAFLWRGIAVGREAALARRYANAFAFDRDGVLSEQELVRSRGKDAARIEAELERLFHKGYFAGCTLKHGPLAVVLQGADRIETRFVTKVCPHCGGTTRLRAGSDGKCEYCGSALRSK